MKTLMIDIKKHKGMTIMRNEIMISKLFIKSKTRVLLLLLLCHFFSGFSQNVFQHDYSQTLVMKLFMSVPDGRGGTKVSNTVETAIDIIKKVDYLSLGAPKIIYLVGWQYNGHDDGKVCCHEWF